MRLKLSIFFLCLLPGCGSPILDHDYNKKPAPASSSAVVPESAPASSDAVPLNCIARFNDTQLCVALRFIEVPTFRTSPFVAELEIWNSETSLWVSSKKTPVVFHQHSKQCCRPPPIEVRAGKEGRYELSNIEFHADGRFEFIIEIEVENKQTDMAMVVVDVAAP